MKEILAQRLKACRKEKGLNGIFIVFVSVGHARMLMKAGGILP